METQYGERYAQKVEDRLLHYLHELEAVLPRETYIDKIMRKESPMTEEDKLLLELITSNSATIAATLRNLLHCDVACCHPARISPSPENRQRGESPEVSGTRLCGSSSLPKLGEGKPSCERRLEVLGSSEEVSKSSFLLQENRNDSADGGQQRPQQCGEAFKDEEEEEENRNQISTPQFCSKHQRWVKSILRGCPDECSEELLNQIKASSSPLLFQSSSSTSSSQDLTPSDLGPCSPDKLLSQTSTSPQTAAEPEKHREDLRSAADAAPPSLLFPVIRLVDIASMWSSCSASKSQASSDHFVLLSSKRSSSHQVLTSPHVQTAPESQPISAPASFQPLGKKTFSKLSRRFRRAANSTRPSQAFTQKPSEDSAEKPGGVSVNYPPFSTDFDVSEARGDVPSSFYVDAPSTSASKSFHFLSACPSKLERFSSKSSLNVVQHKPVRTPRQTRRTKCFPSRCIPTTPPISSSPSQLSSQAAKLQANPLQPVVALTRLSIEECQRLTRRTTAAKRGSSGEERTSDMQESSDSSFDVNILYSTGSSDSDGEDSLHSDPNYKPHKKKESFLRVREWAESELFQTHAD